MPVLLHSLPRAGFQWPEGDKLTNRDASHKRRDQQIAMVLCRHAGCPNLAPGGNKHAASYEVSLALSEMFDQAVALMDAKVLGSNPNTYPFMNGSLRVHVSWGSTIRTDTYMELFHELYKARARWYESPRQPLNVSEHGVLAKAIDRFHGAKGGGTWEIKGLDKLARAGGFLHDEEELEMKDPKDTGGGTGPSDTTLTTLVMLKMMYENSVTKGLIKPKEQKPKEQDGDVEMKDTAADNQAAADDQDLCERSQGISRVNLEGAEEGTEKRLDGYLVRGHVVVSLPC